MPGVSGIPRFLRTSEMTNLQWSKISFNVSTGQIILALPATKTSKNKEESIALHDLKVCYLLQKLKLNSNSIYLWEGSASVFRRQLKEILAFLHLEEDAFAAYSIRRGGATHAFSERVPMDQLVIKGRWQNAKTARIYLSPSCLGPTPFFCPLLPPLGFCNCLSLGLSLRLQQRAHSLSRRACLGWKCQRAVGWPRGLARPEGLRVSHVWIKRIQHCLALEEPRHGSKKKAEERVWCL